MMISVIVPVYKVEKYIDKCVNSILNQTYKNFELILIDDGSPDKCPLICDNYAKDDERVKVLHKKNGGLSDARNFGLDYACGEYVTFIDSDDIVAPEYLETLIYLLEKYNSDIAVTGIAVFSDELPTKKEKKNKEYIYTGEEALIKMLYQDTLDTSACAILLPINIAKQFLFPVGKNHEDEFTTYKYYSNVRKVAVTTREQYFYLQRNGSIMHVFGKSSMDELEAADNLVAFCKKNYPHIVKAAESKKFSDYCQVLLSNSKLKSENPDMYKKIIKYLLSKRKQIIFDNMARKKNRIAAFLLLGGERTLYFVNRIIN